MTLQLTSLELDILLKLMNGEAVRISSQHRLRLELAGAIREGAEGVVVTPYGERLAGQAQPRRTPDPAPDETPTAKDASGRRLPNRRRIDF